MSDLSIENLLGAKDEITKLELALNAELLMKFNDVVAAEEIDMCASKSY